MSSFSVAGGAFPCPLPVTIEGGSVGGGITDQELRASAVPVSISGTIPVSATFWQTTQPVSIASTVNVSVQNGSLAVTGAFYPATQPVSIASMPTTPVTGTFWQATQPVSGTFWQATQPVSGTFWQTTQPVSIAGTVSVTQSGTWNIGSITTLPALPAGANLIGRTQPLYAARVVRNFILDAFTAAPVSEALQSVVQWYNNAAVGATTQPAVVPAGKILRLTSWGIETKSLATVGSAIVRVRANVSGVAVLGSPLAGSFSAGSIAGATTTAMTGAFCGMSGDFGEGGLEFAAGTGIGFSMAGYGPTGTLTLEGVTRFWVYGYEYTA